MIVNCELKARGYAACFARLMVSFWVCPHVPQKPLYVWLLLCRPLGGLCCCGGDREASRRDRVAAVSMAVFYGAFTQGGGLSALPWAIIFVPFGD